MFERRFAPVVFATLAAVVLASGIVRAEGVTRIEQSDGSARVYHHVNIRLMGQTLWIRSGDGKGVLEVASGACSFAGSLERCLPFRATLHQHGTSHPIVLQHGTVYLNLSADVRHLPHSSEELRPRQVLVHLQSARGTYVSVKGTLDEVK